MIPSRFDIQLPDHALEPPEQEVVPTSQLNQSRLLSLWSGPRQLTIIVNWR